MRNDITSVNDEVEDLQNSVRVLRREISRSRINSIQDRPLILKPSKVSSNSNIASMVRREISRINACGHFGAPYDNFPNHFSNTVINRQSKKKLGDLLRIHMPEAYGSMSWTESRSQSVDLLKASEIVIQEDSRMEDFYVFQQTSGHWAIRLLADAKMRTAKRDSKSSALALASVPFPSTASVPCPTNQIQEHPHSNITPAINDAGRNELPSNGRPENVITPARNDRNELPSNVRPENVIFSERIEENEGRNNIGNESRTIEEMSQDNPIRNRTDDELGPVARTSPSACLSISRACSDTETATNHENNPLSSPLTNATRPVSSWNIRNRRNLGGQKMLRPRTRSQGICRLRRK